MGLDMNLYARVCVSGWDHVPQGEKDRFGDLVEAANIDPELICKDAPYVFVWASVFYWRKSYAIDSWFSRECNGGESTGVPVPVDRADLAILSCLCSSLVATKNITHAKKWLPIDEALCRLGVRYDDYYWGDLERTAGGINSLLANQSLDRADFYYQASYC